jgi:biopolymer transport protein ExbD/biopolymer transport protein TolR
VVAAWLHRKGACLIMRRFSQRNALVTLADINITPLLDLAFVLLIIFVITTPLLEQGLNLNLPGGGIQDPPKLNPNDIRTVEISPQGAYLLGGRWLSLEQAASLLIAEHRRNPRLLVYVRADRKSLYEHVAALLDRLETSGVSQVSLRTTPRAR